MAKSRCCCVLSTGSRPCLCPRSRIFCRLPSLRSCIVTADRLRQIFPSRNVDLLGQIIATSTKHYDCRCTEQCCKPLFSIPHKLLPHYRSMIRIFGAYRCFATIMIQFVARQLCEHIGSLALITLQKLMHTSKNIRFTDSIAYAILMSQVF